MAYTLNDLLKKQNGYTYNTMEIIFDYVKHLFLKLNVETLHDQ